MQKRKLKKVKLTAWDKYAKFVADFETTAHKEFTDEEMLASDRSTFAVNEVPVDFTPNKSSQVFLAGLMSFKGYKYRLSYENLAVFFNNIAEMTLAEGRGRAITYIHNLAYDGEYMLKWLIHHHYKQTLRVDKITHQPQILRKEFSLLKSGGKFFSITFWWRGIKLTFLDSMKIFPQSLASLGESIGYKKLKELVDYTKFELRKNHKYPKKWLAYLKRDCEILAHYLRQFFAKEEKAHTIRRQTMSSIAYSYIKKIVDEYTPYKKGKYGFTIADYRKFEPWFSGGLTFPSFKYWGKWVYKPNRIRMIDKVSMYPSMMIKDLPYGEVLETPPKDIPYCTFLKIKIIRARIKDKYDDIALLRKPFEMKNNKKVYHFTKFNTLYQYLQEVENEIYYFTDVELEMIKKIYNIKYRVIKCYYFKKAPYLKEVMTAIFRNKQIAKEKGDVVGTLIAKLRCNSPYGKLGQKPIRQQDYYGDIKKLDKTKYRVVGEKRTLDEAYNIERIRDDSDKAQPIFVGAYITALARCDLIKKYMEIKSKGGIWLYSDTDSLTYIDSIKGIKFNDIGNDLGLWEYEVFKQFKLDKNKDFVLDEEGKPILLKVKDRADGFCCLCPKQYRIVDAEYAIPVKSATAGIKKHIFMKVDNIDYNYDVGNNKKYHIIKTTLKESINGKVIWESPFNFIKWKAIKTNPICPKELING